VCVCVCVFVRLLKEADTCDGVTKALYRCYKGATKVLQRHRTGLMKVN
jgi:hypothetical protein